MNVRRALPDPRGRQTSGFTVVELLVVVSVIGVLVALLMPAVQQSREAARRTQCRSSLHQLALGLHNYQDVHGTYPIGSMTVGPAFTPESGWGWGAMLLPYLDQRPLYERIDFSTQTAVGTNRSTIRTKLPIWVCGSDSAPGEIEADLSSGGHVPVAAGNYCGVESVLVPMRTYRPRDVTDGLSQTLFIGERVNQVAQGVGLSYTSSWCGRIATNTETLPNAIPHLPAVADRPPNISFAEVNAFTSFHRGGVHFALGDGAVRVLANTIDAQVYEALGTRDGQEVVAF